MPRSSSVALHIMPDWILRDQVGPNMRKKASLGSQKQVETEGEPFTHVNKPKTLFHHLYPYSFSFSKRVYPCAF
jgi:hypothetical protein